MRPTPTESKLTYPQAFALLAAFIGAAAVVENACSQQVMTPDQLRTLEQSFALPPPDSPIWKNPLNNPLTAEEYSVHCGGVTPNPVDGTPVSKACYATVTVVCPPACDTYKLAVEGGPGIIRIQ